MVKDVDGYLLTCFIDTKFIVKVMSFSSSKALDIEKYTKLPKETSNHI